MQLLSRFNKYGSWPNAVFIHYMSHERLPYVFSISAPNNTKNVVSYIFNIESEFNDKNNNSMIISCSAPEYMSLKVVRDIRQNKISGLTSLQSYSRLMTLSLKLEFQLSSGWAKLRRISHRS
jgi:hypothetical protein